MLVFVTILSTIIAIVLLYTTLNLLSKNEVLESYIEQRESFINNRRMETTHLLETLHRLDARQMFEKDDEVGSLFDIIKETIEKYAEQDEEEEIKIG